MAAALKKLDVPAEVQLYATGGHGFGMRDTGEPINSWPQRCQQWMQRQGWLSGKPPGG